MVLIGIGIEFTAYAIPFAFVLSASLSIIMLGGGLVFIYDMIPLIAAFKFAKTLPDAFANARMNMSERTLKVISVIGIGILLVQGSLSFSDIDRTGWALVAGYITLVVIYIRIRSKNRPRVSIDGQAQGAVHGD